MHSTLLYIHSLAPLCTSLNTSPFIHIHTHVFVQRCVRYADLQVHNPHIKFARGTHIDVLELLSGTHITTEERQGPKDVIFDKLRSLTRCDWGHLNMLHFQFGWPVEALRSIPEDRSLSEIIQIGRAHV